MTKWIKRIDGVLIAPSANQYCIILINDTDGKSLVPLNAISETSLNNDTCFVLINDDLGEVIKMDRVLAYFTYDYKQLMETI